VATGGGPVEADQGHQAADEDLVEDEDEDQDDHEDCEEEAMEGVMKEDEDFEKKEDGDHASFVEDEFDDMSDFNAPFHHKNTTQTCSSSSISVLNLPSMNA
jgi:hypothetical protein